jgi:hypothetical protein
MPVTLEAAPEVDITYWPRELDELIGKTDDIHQRKMLLNMRRHILLELSGRWREVLAPEYTVEVPKYRTVTPLGALELEGLDAVKEFYSQIFDSSTGVWTPLEEELVVTDHSVIGEAHFAVFAPGKILAAQGHEDLEPDTFYMYTFRQIYVFSFDADAKLIGERSYDSGSGKVWELAPGQLIRFEDAAAALKPYIDNPPAL